jgi:NTP pyrophosphatase (non-canonical NTP hydrolase)
MNYNEFVKKLLKSGDQIKSEITPAECHLIHMVLGLSGEAGELLDAVKKSTIYRKPLDMENVLEELGDIEFFLEGFRQAVGLTRARCIEMNIAKLQARYHKLSYSDSQAQERADKNA